PSWLEPLARNAATASTTEQPITREERPKEEPLFSGTLVAESLADTAPQIAEADTRPFGSAFVVSDKPVGGRPAKASRKGILIATIAAALLLAGAGVTWYVRNQDGAQRATTRGSVATSATAQTPAPAATQGVSVAPTAPPATSAASAPVAASVVSPTPVANNAMATSGGASASNAAAKSAQPAPVQPATPAQVQPQPKKPSLGEVRLAAPKVGGSTPK